MKEKRNRIEDKQDNMEEKPEGTKEKSAGASESPEGTGEKTAGTRESSEGTEEKSAGARESSEGTEEKTAGAEEKPESTEKRSGTESTGEVPAADKTENKSKGEKKQGSRKKITGIVELAVAILLIMLSAWLFINTRGTRLLYVSVTTGRVSRYYWVFFSIAAMFTVLGLITLKSSRKKGREDLPEKDKQTRAEE